MKTPVDFFIGMAIALSPILIAFVLVALFWLRWIAQGESDVNGDPERDGAGMDKLEQPDYGYCPNCWGYDPDCICRSSCSSRPSVQPSTKNNL